MKRATIAATFLLISTGAALASSSVLGILPKTLVGAGNGGDPISCAEGKALLRAKGFTWSAVIDCRPRYLIYWALKNGNNYTVTVDARLGRVTDASKE